MGQQQTRRFVRNNVWANIRTCRSFPQKCVLGTIALRKSAEARLHSLGESSSLFLFKCRMISPLYSASRREGEFSPQVSSVHSEECTLRHWVNLFSRNSIYLACFVIVEINSRQSIGTFIRVKFEHTWSVYTLASLSVLRSFCERFHQLSMLSWLFKRSTKHLPLLFIYFTFIRANLSFVTVKSASCEELVTFFINYRA